MVRLIVDPDSDYIINLTHNGDRCSIAIDGSSLSAVICLNFRRILGIIAGIGSFRCYIQGNIIVNPLVLLILHAHYRVPVRHVKLIHSARRRFVFLFDPFPDHCQRRLVSGLYLYVYLH